MPYGCLLPKKIDGLLLSGRNISGSHLAHSNFRIMSVCLALGEAAGTAAALAAKKAWSAANFRQRIFSRISASSRKTIIRYNVFATVTNE
ncbi:MAG: FAD-dependent oxidoreductase [Christensenellales bacterium]